MNLKDLILNKQDKKLTPLTVEEWGVTVHLRTWSGSERAKFQDWYKTQTDMGKLLGMLCAMSVCDEAGNRLFTEADVDALNEKSVTALDAVAAAVLALNGITPDAVEQAKND